jgi:hypothetical protein
MQLMAAGRRASDFSAVVWLLGSLQLFFFGFSGRAALLGFGVSGFIYFPF